MVDMVVHRHELRADARAALPRCLTKAPAATAAPAPSLPAPARRCRLRRPTARNRRPPMTPVDSILARLLALHPKRIDLSLDRMRRMLERARPSGTARCRR